MHQASATQIRQTRYQCLTLHPTPPVPMFTMSNQDSDSKEPFKHPKVGFCSLTWYSENVQSSSQRSIFWNWALCPRPVRLSDCRLRSCRPETERFHSNVQRRVCRQAWDRRRRFRLYLDETHRWNYSWGTRSCVRRCLSVSSCWTPKYDWCHRAPARVR